MSYLKKRLLAKERFEVIRSVVEMKTGISIQEMKSISRKHAVTMARTMFCYFAFKEGISQELIGDYLHRNHSTIFNYIKRANEFRDVDKRFKALTDDFYTYGDITDVYELDKAGYSGKIKVLEPLRSPDCIISGERYSLIGDAGQSFNLDSKKATVLGYGTKVIKTI